MTPLWIIAGIIAVYGVWVFFVREEPFLGDYGVDVNGVLHTFAWAAAVVIWILVFGGIYWW